jgi:hypothetical protein
MSSHGCSIDHADLPSELGVASVVAELHRHEWIYIESKKLEG